MKLNLMKPLLTFLMLLMVLPKTIAQEQESVEYEFLFNGCGKGEFYEYFSHHLKVWGNERTFNMFVFKLKGNGEITEMKHLGGMEKSDAEHVLKFIKQSESCWNLPKDPNRFKWIIIPFVSGKGKYKSDPSFAYSTLEAFGELNNLTSYGIYSGDFYVTRLIFYLDPQVKLD